MYIIMFGALKLYGFFKKTILNIIRFCIGFLDLFILICRGVAYIMTSERDLVYIMGADLGLGSLVGGARGPIVHKPVLC